jgi:hypothetical protein
MQTPNQLASANVMKSIEDTVENFKRVFDQSKESFIYVNVTIPNALSSTSKNEEMYLRILFKTLKAKHNLYLSHVKCSEETCQFMCSIWSGYNSIIPISANVFFFGSPICDLVFRVSSSQETKFDIGTPEDHDD